MATTLAGSLFVSGDALNGKLSATVTVISELQAEQAYVDFAYECAEQTRLAALRAVAQAEASGGPGGTFQAQFERDVMWERMSQRAAQMELGAGPLCFGRIDLDEKTLEELGPPDRFYIGRLAVSDPDQNQLVVDWRAPVAEPFYRATGAHSMGLARRRHFIVRGRELLGLDDELFGDAAKALDAGTVQGEGALIAALESARTGKLSDIVATIQAEQDEIIRAPMPGVLVVQGGPGTGKTVVALHRAAYLLYTHRFPLEDQGVLVLGPNRLFLNYIDQVLPSLGEAGAVIAVLGDLVPNVRVQRWDSRERAVVKGDARMATVLRRAVRNRQRPLTDTLVVPYGTEKLRLRVDESRRIVGDVRRRVRVHNAGRRLVEDRVYAALAAASRHGAEANDVRERVRKFPEVREALERMWPLLTPAELLNETFGSAQLLRSAGRDVLSEAEMALLRRERVRDVESIVWAHQDAPLLDEARHILGPHPRRRGDDEIRTYGHIVVDEAQDLSPMEVRAIRRRSLNGSMTLVGDVAQATSAWANESWDGLARALSFSRDPRFTGLHTGYRLPGPIMQLAARVLAVAAPGLAPPDSVRRDGVPPTIETVVGGDFADALARAVRREREAVGMGSVAVLTPASLTGSCEQALRAHGIDVGRADRRGLSHQVTVVPVALAKGLELDAAIIVEPQTILDEEAKGSQALFVALTRCTQRLSILQTRPLPTFMH